MRPATVALALRTALDIGAARRLHDYGRLDDAGVTRALEQVYMQRFAALDWPAHLCRLTHVAAVIEQGDDVGVVAVECRDDEAAALVRFFAHWPEGDGVVVAWRNREPALIAARAFMHDVRMPSGLSDASRIALAERLSPEGIGVPRPDHDTETELAQLLGGGLADHCRGVGDSVAARLRYMAVNRYRWWLRWQHVHGTITHADHDRRAAALTAGLRAVELA